MKRRIYISIAILTVIVSAMTILFSCSAPKPANVEKVLNFSGLQKPAPANFKPKNKIVWDEVIRDPSKALQAVLYAEENSAKARQQINFILTESTIRGNEGTSLEKLDFLNRSTYLTAQDTKGRSYSQTISAPVTVKMGSADLSSMASQLGYVRRSISGGGLPDASTGGSNGKFQEGEVTVISGATADFDKWKGDKSIDEVSAETRDFGNGQDYSRYQVVRKGGSSKSWKDVILKDPVNNKEVGAIRLSDGEWIPIWGEYEYQRDEEVLDLKKSKINHNKKEGYYEITLVYKDAPSKYKGTNGKPLYTNIVDQACRYAAAALWSDMSSIPIIKMKNLQYTQLAVTYQIWESGFFKKMARTETMQAYTDVMFGAYKGEGKAVNTAYKVWSYTDEDTNLDRYEFRR